jgi:hypothetical protein
VEALVRIRTLLLPALVAVLLTISASAAQAAAFVLTLTDLDTPGATVTIDDNSLSDFNGSSDGIVFLGTVGSFDVQVFGTTWIPGPTGAPVQMDLSNFLISSATGGRFTASLSRTGLASALFGGPTVVGIETYGATFAEGTVGSVTFQSWIDPNNSGTAAGTTVFNPAVTTTSNLGPPPPVMTSDPIALLGEVSLFSTLEFNLVGAGSMNANTDLQVAAVPEPTTLLLFGPGMVGLAALRRRLRSKAV